MKVLHLYLLKFSKILVSYSFPGEQIHSWKNNKVWNKLSKQYKKQNKKAKNEDPQLYVWALSNIDIDFSVDVDDSKRFLKDSHLFGFSVMYCSKTSWENEYSRTFEREKKTHVSSMSGKQNNKGNEIRTPAEFEPGDYSTHSGYRSRRATKVAPYTLVSASDYGIDFERLKREWNVSAPTDMESILNTKYRGTLLGSGNIDSTPKTKVLTGSSAIKKKTGLSRLSQMESSQSSQVNEEQEQSSSQSQRRPSQKRDDSEIAPSQEDFSALFSLLGDD